ncbi:MAG: peptide deformylase [Acidobacteriota bacterium]
MAVLPILRYPHETLLTESQPVRGITPDLERLIMDMIETMHAAPGVGLAANQIGVTRTVAVIDLSVGQKKDDLIVLINPRVLESTGKHVEDEGCLSLPGFNEKVWRPHRCVIEAMDLEGRVRTVEGEGLLARAFNHEIDHLHGRLFIEHLSTLKRRLIRRKVHKRMKSGDWDLVPA